MFDLRTLRLEVGDEHRARINVRVEPFTVGHETYTPTAEELPAELRITRLRSGLLFSLRFEVTLHGPCHRCLEDAEVTLAIESEEYQDNHPEPGRRGRHDLRVPRGRAFSTRTAGRPTPPSWRCRRRCCAARTASVSARRAARTSTRARAGTMRPPATRAGSELRRLQ